MTMTLTSVNDLIEISPPTPSVVSISPPGFGPRLSVATPPVAIEIRPGPPVPGIGLVVPVSGQAGRDGHDGAPGAPGDPDLIDLATLFENGLF